VICRDEEVHERRVRVEYVNRGERRNRKQTGWSEERELVH
jgi:hypothetical protein